MYKSSNRETRVKLSIVFLMTHFAPITHLIIHSLIMFFARFIHPKCTIQHQIVQHIFRRSLIDFIVSYISESYRLFWLITERTDTCRTD